MVALGGSWTRKEIALNSGSRRKSTARPRNPSPWNEGGHAPRSLDEHFNGQSGEQENPCHYCRQDHPRVGWNQGVRIGPRPPQSEDRFDREGKRQEGEESPRGQGEQ